MFIFFNPQVQFVLPKYSWTCSLPLECSQLSRSYPLSENGLFFSHQQTIENSSMARDGIQCILLHIHVKIMSELLFHSVCACCHYCCEFVCLDSLQCPEDTVSLCHSPSGFSTLLIWSSVFCNNPWALGGRGMTYIFHLGSSILYSLIPCKLVRGGSLGELSSPIANRSFSDEDFHKILSHICRLVGAKDW